MKIIVDPGHGGRDTGACACPTEFETDVIRESEWVLSQGRFLMGLLREAGHQVRMTRTTDVFVGLQSRAWMANSWGADFFISLHCNYYEPRPEARSNEVWHHPATSSGDELARDLLARLSSSWTSSHDRGLKVSSTLSVLRHTRMPAVLVETGFLSNPEDVEWLARPEAPRETAEALALGVADFVGG